MTIDSRGRDVSEIGADGDVRECGQIEFNRIGVNRFTTRNDDAGAPAKRKPRVRGRDDVTIAGAGRAEGNAMRAALMVTESVP